MPEMPEMPLFSGDFSPFVPQNWNLELKMPATAAMAFCNAGSSGISVTQATAASR